MIHFEINQQLLPAKFRLQEAWVARILRAIETHLKLRGTVTLSIAFVDHRTMRTLNRIYRNKDRATDILSFAEIGGPKSMGELIMAWPYVQKQAKQKKVTLMQEVALLVVHGALHLKGFDHETKADAKKMFLLQDQILWTLGSQ